MVTPEEDVLKFSVAVDIKKSLKAMEKFQRQMAKSMKAIARGEEGLAKESKRQAKETTRGIKGTTAAYGAQADEVANLNDAISELTGKVLKLKGQEKERAQESLDFLKQELVEKEKLLKTAEDAKKKPAGKKGLERIKGDLEKAGEALVEPLKEFLKRDLDSVLEASMKLAGTALSRSIKSSKAWSEKMATFANNRAERASNKHKGEGGSGDAGKGMKLLGGLMGKMGKFMGLLNAIAPAISVASGFVVGLVKMFIDADSMVKDLNRSIMESASNLEFLQGTGGKASLAIERMDNALQGVRNAALDQSFNNALGITKDTHTAILNTLNQEGVAFGKLAAEAGNTAQGMKDLTQSIVKIGVAYSRGLGIPLSEISSLQAEMMIEMGKSVEETHQAFALMATAAEDSGMAANKFFTTIRGLSSDLGLFNLRLEDSVALLSRISKVMSPREAQKFMAEAAQGLKAMSREEKTTLSHFAGKEARDVILKKDVERKTQVLIESIAIKSKEAPETVRADFESKGLAGIQDRLDTINDSALTSSAVDLDLQKQQASKGEYGKDMAIADLGVGAAMELKMTAALKKIGKASGKQFASIRDAIGDLGFESVANNLGYSDETIKSFGKFEVAMAKQRRILLKSATTELGIAVTQDEVLAAQKKIEAVNRMGNDDLIAAMTDEDKEKAGVDGKTTEERMLALSRAQGAKTQSFQEKLSNLVDWIMNEFYKVVLGIWGTLLNALPDWGNTRLAEKEQLAALRKGLALNAEIASLTAELNSTKEDDPKFDTLVKKLEALEKRRKDNADFLAGKKPDSAPKLEDAARNAVHKALGLDKAPTAAAQTSQGEIDRGNLLKSGFVVGGPAPAEEAKPNARGTDRNAVAGALFGAGAPTAPAIATVPTASELPASVAVPGQPAAPSLPPAVAEALVKTPEQLAVVAAESKRVETVLSGQGVKLAPASLKEGAKGMEASMLSALRIALFEFYMYNGTDRDTLLAAMDKGGVTDPRDVAQRYGAASTKTGGTLGALRDVGTAVAPGNALGGLVTGVRKGMAVVARQGEGLASVGRGERITPASGGAGGGVQISVNGVGGADLARLIEGKVVEGIREYKRREKFN